MVEYLVGSLILALLLSLFGFHMAVEIGLQELFGLHTSTGTYFFLFAIGGIIAWIFDKARTINFKGDK